MQCLPAHCSLLGQITDGGTRMESRGVYNYMISGCDLNSCRILYCASHGVREDSPGFCSFSLTTISNHTAHVVVAAITAFHISICCSSHFYSIFQHSAIHFYDLLLPGISSYCLCYSMLFLQYFASFFLTEEGPLLHSQVVISDVLHCSPLICLDHNPFHSKLFPAPFIL